MSKSGAESMQIRAMILAKTPWDTRQKHTQNCKFVANPSQNSVALIIWDHFRQCPTPSSPKQRQKHL